MIVLFEPVVVVPSSPFSSLSSDSPVVVGEAPSVVVLGPVVEPSSVVVLGSVVEPSLTSPSESPSPSASALADASAEAEVAVLSPSIDVDGT